MAVGFRSLASIGAQRQLSSATNSLQRNLERLSTGQRINRASDDAAGLSVSTTLNAKSRIFSQGVRNLNDGISALNIADGALSQGSNMLQRLRELATQAANGVFSRTQRLALDEEASALTNEFNRIMSSTSFNRMNLYDNSISEIRLQGGIGTNESLSFAIGQGLSRNVGTGSLGDGANIASDTNAEHAVDIDNDGDIDLITTFGTTTVKIYKNNGSGQFSLHDSIAVTNLEDVAVADFNGDGSSDLFIIGTNSYGIVANDGSGSFGSYSGHGVFGEDFKEVISGDFNNDGKQDVLIASALSGAIPPPWGQSLIAGDFAYVMLGDGTTNVLGFDAMTGVETRFDIVQKIEFVVADMNGDSILDLIDAVDSGKVSIFYGSGNGTFQSENTVAVNGLGLGADVGDFNHDGLNDIVLSTDGGGVELLMNQGGGSFAHSVISGLEANYYTGATVADIDGDGNDDAYVTGIGVPDVILLSDGEGGFRQTEFGYRSVDTRTSVFADFTGDGVVDLAGYDGNEARIELFTQESRKSTNIQRFNLTTREGALDALDEIETAMNRVLTERGLVGSTLSRLNSAISNLDSRRLGYDEANARIRDVDIAQESAELVRNTILQQVSQAVLAQANTRGELALRLLQNL